MTDDSSLQKQDLLLKMLNMTTSDNDGITLVAIRKANKLLADSGWSWEKLLLGKITIVEDPFKAASPFDTMLKERAASPPPSPPPPKYEPYTPPYTPPPRPKPTINCPRDVKLTAVGTKGNNYANSCYCCGDWVDVQSGFIFRPSDITPSAHNKWAVVCKPCNTPDTYIARTAAPRSGKVAGAPSSVNLDSL